MNIQTSAYCIQALHPPTSPVGAGGSTAGGRLPPAPTHGAGALAAAPGPASPAPTPGGKSAALMPGWQGMSQWVHTHMFSQDAAADGVPRASSLVMRSNPFAEVPDGEAVPDTESGLPVGDASASNDLCDDASPEGGVPKFARFS